MYYSLQTLAKLADETILYPGHNYAGKPFDTIAQQRRHNMYLQLSTKSLQDFLAMMG
jgi:hypothetical protein